MAATPSTSSKRCKVDSECRGEINVLSCSRLDVLTWFFPAWPATSLSGTHLARDPKKFADPCLKVIHFRSRDILKITAELGLGTRLPILQVCAYRRMGMKGVSEWSYSICTHASHRIQQCRGSKVNVPEAYSEQRERNDENTRSYIYSH